MTNGIIVIDKPINYTSRDVVNKCNHIFKTKKIGHTGTLDPLATGVLVLCIGSYTKLVNYITSHDKTYIATIKFGIKTDTDDITGNIIDKKDVNIKINQIKEVFNNFPKSYLQTVPKYSAVKINGRKLYDYARNNENIDLPKRNVNIYNIEIQSYDEENQELTFKTCVSKGTYIRSLINDICTNLNVIGTMSSLRRISQGNFNINMSHKLENINENTKLLNVNDVFPDLITINMDDLTYKKVINGNKIEDCYDSYVLYIYNGKEIALYKFENNIGNIVMFINKTQSV